MPHFGLTFSHLFNEEHDMEFSLSIQLSTMHRPFTGSSTNIHSLVLIGGSTNGNRLLDNPEIWFSQKLIFSFVRWISGYCIFLSIYLTLRHLLQHLQVFLWSQQKIISICSFCHIHIPTWICAHIRHLPSFKHKLSIFLVSSNPHLYPKSHSLFSM